MLTFIYCCRPVYYTVHDYIHFDNVCQNNKFSYVSICNKGSDKNVCLFNSEINFSLQDKSGNPLGYDLKQEPYQSNAVNLNI